MIDDLNHRLDGEQVISDQAKNRVLQLQGEIDALNSKVDDLNEKLAKLTKTRDDLFDKADSYMIPVEIQGRMLFRYPRSPKSSRPRSTTSIATPSTKPIARVDRCQSCHAAEDKKGFENAPEPFRTHSNFHQIIDQHPADKLGCTPCHEGQGAAVNSMADGPRRHRALGATAAHAAPRCSRDASSAISMLARCATPRASKSRQLGDRANGCSSRLACATVAIWLPVTRKCRKSAPI